MNKHLKNDLRRYRDAELDGELFTWLLGGKYKSYLVGFIDRDMDDGTVWLNVPVYFVPEDDLISWSCEHVPKEWLVSIPKFPGR